MRVKVRVDRMQWVKVYKGRVGEVCWVVEAEAEAGKG